MEVNNIIININNNIDEINTYLRIKEPFYQNTNTNPEISTVIGFTNLISEFSNYNNKVSGHFENIIKLSNIIKRKITIQYKIKKEIDLNNNVNLYYSKLIEIFKNKQISNDDFMFSADYEKLEESTYMKIFGDLVMKLDEKKIELQLTQKNTNDKLLQTKRKFNKNKFVEVNYKLNESKVAILEIELLKLYNTINDLKEEMSNFNILKDARNKLKDIKQLNINIQKENVNNFNVLEPFVSSVNYGNSNNLKSRFNTIQSHTDGYLSVLPNDYSNEYKININGKCLSSYSNMNYNLEQCENKNSQFFEPKLIDSASSSESINKDKVYDNFVKYPYYQMVSTLSSDCLTKEGDNVSIIPCTSNNNHQRWNLVENQVKCLDN